MSVHTSLRSWFVGLTLGIRSLVCLHCGLTLTLALAPAPAVYADQGCEFPDELDSDEPDGDECGPIAADKHKNLGSVGSVWSSDTNAQCLVGQSSGDPIDNTTGNVFETETDYAGAGAIPLVFTRFYNSQSPVTSGPLGTNWSHSYSAHLVRQSTTVIQAVRADQKTLTFTLTNGQWVSDADVNSRLTQASSLWLYTTRDDNVEKYDASGKLLRIVTRAGLTQSLHYNAQGVLTSVTDPFGRALTFTYDGAGRLSHMTDPAGQVYTYSYDANNNPSAVTYPDGTSRTYVYGISAFPHALHELVDENGVRFATWNYNSKGLATSSLLAGGVDNVTVKYDFPDGASYVTDARSNTSVYAYFSALGAAHTAEATKPGTSTNTSPIHSFWFYDAQGNISSYTDYNGNITTFTYDLTRNLETSRTDPLQRTVTTTWHPTFRLPIKITEPNRVTTFTYDARGNLLQKTLTAGSLSRTWLYTYNANGQVTSVDGPRTDVADVTHFAYDSKGNLISVTDALGHVTKITAYDVHGRPLTIVDPNGLTTTLKYDLRGRLLSRQVGTELTTYRYDKAGQLLKWTHPDGSLERFSYDGAHRLRTVTDTLSDKVVYSWDLADNLLKVQVFDPQGHLVRTRSQTFDTRNRLVQSIGAQGQTTDYDYDNNDNLTGITDLAFAFDARHYDSLDRLISSNLNGTALTQYGYDVNDNLVSVTDPLNHTTTYGYTGLGDQRRTTSPDTGLSYNSRDAAGNVLSSTDARGQRIFYTYDALNRVISIRFAGGTVLFTYDQGTNGIGHLTQVSDPTGQTNWVYDQHGRVLSETQKVGTLSLVAQYSYDESGRLASLTYPSGQVVTFTYTKGLVTQLAVNGTALLSGIHYEPFGPTNSWFWGNGTADIRQFDLDGRLVAYDLGPSRHGHLTYDNDPVGHITGYTDTNTANLFFYNLDGRIILFEDSNSVLNYDYDANGNRTQWRNSWCNTCGSDTYTYDANSNHLLSISGTHPRSYTYDAAGHITGDGTNTFAYDGRGRLVQVTTSQGTIKYKLNGLGQRVGKPGLVFVYDEAGHLLGEYTPQGQAIEETVYLGDMPVAVLQGAAHYFVYADQLNAPRALMDTNNTIVWHWDSEPFGTGLPQGTLTYNLRGPGQYCDQERGLFYNYFRDYDPLTGRYIESDPLGLAGGSSPYVYVKNNPVSASDPLGLAEVFIYVSHGRDKGIPGLPIQGAGEVVGVYGYNSEKGFYTAHITAAGLHVGSEENYVAAYKGKEVTYEGEVEDITMQEGNVGAEVLDIAGLGGTAGHYHTAGHDSEEHGVFLGISGGFLSEHGAVGVGFPFDLPSAVSTPRQWCPTYHPEFRRFNKEFRLEFLPPLGVFPNTPTIIRP